MKSNSYFKLVLAILLLLISVGSAVGNIPEIEREALIALYKSTGGDNWANNNGWLGPPGTEENWYGVTCQYGRVDRLILEKNNLVGRIPPELGNLKQLSSLSLVGNQLSGPIPPELGNIKQCAYLKLSGNKLSGPIPPELGINKLLYILLGLDNNELSGSIPPELGNIKVVMRLELQNNKLSGSIPPELGNISSLLLLDLRSNELSGSIPSELGKLKELGGLALGSNKLTGSIPSELRNLKELRNNNCDFRYNSLHTHDDSLRDFLNSKQKDGDWEGTQTVAPIGVEVSSLAEGSFKVSWTPIRYQEFSGGYKVFYSTTSGGPYTLFGKTEDKNTSSLDVTGLKTGTTYYFVVQTVTDPHASNNNTVVSEYSKEVSGRIKE